MVRETISTFEEKVDRLERSSLWHLMTSSGWKVSWDFQNDRPGDEAKCLWRLEAPREKKNL